MFCAGSDVKLSIRLGHIVLESKDNSDVDQYAEFNRALMKQFLDLEEKLSLKWSR